jgi:hypothetical protein
MEDLYKTLRPVEIDDVAFGASKNNSGGNNYCLPGSIQVGRLCIPQMWMIIFCIIMFFIFLTLGWMAVYPHYKARSLQKQQVAARAAQIPMSTMPQTVEVSFAE